MNLAPRHFPARYVFHRLFMRVVWPAVNCE